jgi:GR25 family glycosyltransferase involved in LPS biosynthesis
MGITGERFQAIRMDNGAIGCTMSHIKCLELAKQRNYPQVFICEDDILFTNPEILKENLAKFEQSPYYDNYNVLILGGNNCPPYEKTSEYCIKVSNCQTTTGYIVKNTYYDTLINNFREGVKLFMKNPDDKKKYAIDIYWKNLQHQDNWYMIIPPTVIQYENYSDIEKCMTNYSNMLLDLDKEWMFRRMNPTFRPMTMYYPH